MKHISECINEWLTDYEEKHMETDPFNLTDALETIRAELCTCPIEDGLQVHFYGCGDESWWAEDAAPVDGECGMSATEQVWWRDVSTWRDRLLGDRHEEGVVLTEAEPGIVHVTTETMGELLEMAGFKRESTKMSANTPDVAPDDAGRHGATIYTTGRCGCWWSCACGAKAGDLRRTGRGASLSWALHVAEATE